jgi:hypothetical protein
MPTDKTTGAPTRHPAPAAGAAPWWQGETIIPLRDAPHHLPLRPNSKHYDASSIYRWTMPAGKYGVRLRRFRTGPRGWHTTVEELQRFAMAMTAIAGGDV